MKRSSQIYSNQQFPMSNCLEIWDNPAQKLPQIMLLLGKFPVGQNKKYFHCCEQVMSGLVVEEHTCRSDQMSHHSPAVPSSVISHTSPGWSYRHHFTCHLCPDVTRLYNAYSPHSFPFCRQKTRNTIIWSPTKIQHQQFWFASKLFLMWFFLPRLQSIQLFELFSPNLRVLSCPLQISF